MAQQIINVGTNPNDGTGDTLRGAFIKTDDNFTELYSDKENTANKSATTTLGTSNVLFPTQNAVKTYVDTQVASATIPDADATTKGKIQLAGDLSGTAAAPTVPALATKENTANKSTATTLGNSDVLFPTQNAVKTYVDNGLSTKQNTLISGTNIKTINSTSLLGSGNVSVQATLVSGTNIKTINGNSLLGSGDLTISGGITGSGTDNYIPRFNGSTALENSIIFDNGTNVGIGTSNPDGTVPMTINANNNSYYSTLLLTNSNTGTQALSQLQFRTANQPSNPLIIHQFNFDGAAQITNTANSSLQLGTNNTERMRITSNGNVGIGTSSPVTKLDLGSSTGQKLSIYASGNDRAGFGIETSTLRYYTPTNTIHSFGHLSTSDGVTFSERMQIDSNGNVGIGTSTPSTLLDVNGIITAIGGNSTQWNSKQENLVSGTNIKTLNGNDVLGSGDLSTKGIHTLVKPEVGETTSFLLYAQSIGNVVGQANRLTAVPYIPATTITCSSLYINVTTALAGSNARILIYSDDNGKPGTKIYESANLDCSTTGIKTATTTQTFEAGKIYWICSHSSSTQSFSSAFPNALIPINVSAISVFTSYYITPTFGSAPTTFGTGTFIQLSIPFIGIKI